MRLERIMSAAINDVRNGKAEPHCGTLATWVSATDPLNEITWADGYAEPGYHDPAKGVLFGNWNQYPKRLTDILEKAGYAIEWADEWSTCEGCNKAVRTEPDSYSWQPSYIWESDCAIVCLDCADYPAYLESLEDDPTKACMRSCDPGEYGYVRLSDAKEYENGFHPGQTDAPAAILKTLQAKGYEHIVFRLAETSQFYVRFETWYRPVEDEETED